MIGLLYSYLFVGGILGLATLLDRFTFFTDEHSRKFIHIAVSHWFIIAMFVFESAWLATVVPFSFILLNYLSYRYNLIGAMERDEQNVRDLGTVYYAISLTIITYVAFSYWLFYEGLFAILAMGYGDAFAAIVGRRFSHIKLYGGKSLFGTLTLFFIVLILGFFLLENHYWEVVLIAIMASFVELFTKKGFDNLTLPLSIFFVLVLIL